MTRTSVIVTFVIFTANFVANDVNTLNSDGVLKFFGSFTAIKNVRTPELLNQLCNESQGANRTLRDACYGCFYRASNQPTTGYPILLAMSACADLYLNNTDYGHCQAYLKNATSNLNTKLSPTTIYCTFLECIRQVNKDNLDALRSVKRQRLEKVDAHPFVKICATTLRPICIVRQRNADIITIRPGAEPIDPRDP